jgi:ribosomal protein S13
MLDIFKPVVTGFKLLASETKWVFIKAFRRWEIRQMEKRLAEEHQTLGKSYAQSVADAKDFDPKAGDNDLTLRQIAFLREELAHLEQDLEATRAAYVRERTKESGV